MKIYTTKVILSEVNDFSAITKLRIFTNGKIHTTPPYNGMKIADEYVSILY